jgi:hypothetical protein
LKTDEKGRRQKADEAERNSVKREGRRETGEAKQKKAEGKKC